MATIIAGSPAEFTVSVQTDGKPVPLSGQLQARVFSMDGKRELIQAVDLIEDDGWPDGEALISLSESQTADLAPGDAMLVLSGPFGIKRFRLIVETLFEPTRTSLFIKDIVVEELRNDRLMSAAAGVLTGVSVSDEYLWQKIRAAESEISHILRVPLVPTHFFTSKPTAEQIAAIDGMAWAVEPAYDYEPSMFYFERWGYFITRQRPIVEIKRMWFAYPSANDGWFNVPKDWIRTDDKYGHIRLVPSSPAVFQSMSTFMMTALSGSRSIPFMINLEYVAGLTDVDTNYPELLDAIKKLAVLKVVADAFLPQSGSISADGLSESLTVDMGKYHETVDRILNGEPGSNGGLMAKLHGVRMLVM
ncbi:hypothetical protein K32_49220 [Kaistia sp. 32K]|uniref:hypothetical protein n=1 Tax=Kaistia sp. 32K TaxID=2795690 RepID=UPI0019165612|nr:hypothetical protein [Kaistia sp. 32K]BCP56305.1 hypothetical protein K32_49220 [Kaistia sp. 32K]